MTDSQVKLLDERMQKYITSRKHINIYTSEKEYQHFSNFLEDEQSYDLVVDTANYMYPYFPGISKKTATHFEMCVTSKHNEALFSTDSERIKHLLEAVAGIKIREGFDQSGNPIKVLSGTHANILKARMMVLKTNNIVVSLEGKILSHVGFLTGSDSSTEVG